MKSIPIKQKRTFPLPQEVRLVLEQIWKTGFEAYLVGGAVRDYCLGLEVKDFDIATSARPLDLQCLFPLALCVGKVFGVFKIPGGVIEVASFRQDGVYKDGRHPESVIFSDACSDAKRRDFTINGLFYDPRSEFILDYVGGLLDLEQKRLCAIGEARFRFQEDALRLLRAVRFSARFGFSIEHKTEQAICEMAPLLSQLSVERVREELERMLQGPAPERAIQQLNKLALWGVLFPEYPETRLQEALKCLSQLSDLTQEASIKTSAFYWAVLFLGLPAEGVSALSARLKFSATLTKQLLSLSQHNSQLLLFHRLSRLEQQRWIRFKEYADWELLIKLRLSLEPEGSPLYKNWHAVKQLYQAEQRAGRIPLRPLIRGQDLLDWGYQAGPKLGELLQLAEDLQLLAQVTSREEIKHHFSKKFPI